MELSIYTDFFVDLPWQDRLSKIVAAGFAACELNAPNPFGDTVSSQQVSQLRQQADRLGLKMSQAHGYWGEYLAPGSEQWRNRLSLFKEEIAIAADLGVKVIVAHPMDKTGILKAVAPMGPAEATRQVVDHSVRFFSEVLDDLASSSVRIALENMPCLDQGYTSIDELMVLVRALDSEQVGICLDSGHLNQASGDIGRFIVNAGAKLFATHMHDCLNLTGHDLHLFPLFSTNGKSWVDWGLVRDSLRDIDYQRNFSLETPGEGPPYVPLWLREKKLAFIHDCLTQFLTEPTAMS